LIPEKSIQKIVYNYDLLTIFSLRISSLKSTYKFNVTYDKDIIAMMLTQNTEHAIAINNSIIRKHFRELTNCFMNEFDEYFQRQSNDVKKFEEKEFLKGLKLKNYKFR